MLTQWAIATDCSRLERANSGSAQNYETVVRNELWWACTSYLMNDNIFYEDIYNWNEGSLWCTDRAEIKILIRSHLVQSAVNRNCTNIHIFDATALLFVSSRGGSTGGSKCGEKYINISLHMKRVRIIFLLGNSRIHFFTQVYDVFFRIDKNALLNSPLKFELIINPSVACVRYRDRLLFSSSLWQKSANLVWFWQTLYQNGRWFNSFHLSSCSLWGHWARI